MAKSAHSTIDEFDAAILNLVQSNNQITHGDIGDQVGLSNSAVRRRLTRLRDEGVIERDVSILKDDNIGVTLIISVSFATDTPAGYDAFDRFIADEPNVKQCYHVSGSTDYILIVKGPSLQWYETWAKDTLMSNDDLQRHDTCVVYSCKKFDTTVQL